MSLSLSIALAAADVVAASGMSQSGDMPSAVVAVGEGFTNLLSRVDAVWTDGMVSVAVDSEGRVSVRSPGRGLSSVTLNWTREWPCGAKVLNDAWERSYGDLKWQTLGTNTVYSPWYFLAEKDGKTQGYGVETFRFEPDKSMSLGVHEFSAGNGNYISFESAGATGEVVVRKIRMIMTDKMSSKMKGV